MELGFETIGNATLVCHDRRPVLATDPWIEGAPYFGSWAASHEIPRQQREAIEAAEWVWFSHGHPDHLNAESLAHFRGTKILLPDHYGGRIFRDLESEGFDVHVAPDRQWMSLSDRVRILCVSDYNQDAVLLVDVGGVLVINLNDASSRGWRRLVRKAVQPFAKRFLVALTGFGDACMVNYWDEHGRFIPPVAAQRLPVGPQIARLSQEYGARYFIPFSSMHKYQRSDSIEMNSFITRLEDYAVGFESEQTELLPAYVRYDVLQDRIETIDPPETPDLVVPCEKFGDDWSESLDPGDVEKVRRYFLSFQHLEDYLDHVTLKVGGREHVIEFAKRGFGRGLVFEVPRGSLMTAVEYQVFDDLLIGNFMRTTLLGDWPTTQIYPHFEPYVTKYGDNAGAHSREELREYFRHYRKRAPVEYLMHRFAERSGETFRKLVPEDSGLYRLVKRSYWMLRERGGRSA